MSEAIIIITSRMQASGERSPALHTVGGRGLVSQIIEPVTFARCAFMATVVITLGNLASFPSSSCLVYMML